MKAKSRLQLFIIVGVSLLTIAAAFGLGLALWPALDPRCEQSRGQDGATLRRLLVEEMRLSSSQLHYSSGCDSGAAATVYASINGRTSPQDFMAPLQRAGWTPMTARELSAWGDPERSHGFKRRSDSRTAIVVSEKQVDGTLYLQAGFE